MNSSEKPVNRKTGRLIAKNLIILTVLVTVCSLSIWAWFTKGSTAIANGIEIKSKGDGVQVSWDGKNFYDNLQELDSEKIVAEKVGPALNISGVEGQPAPLKLVTGNGLQFFEPYLNRRTGNVLYSGSDMTKNWYGVDIVDGENSEGKYIDIDLYFRSDTQRTVYLAEDSRVSPKSDNDRMSEYGNFSKDNIASASRIAFLDSTKKNCSFIWAPNDNCKLVEDESGYQKYTTTEEEEITTSGGSDGVLNGGAVDDGKDYYLWTFKDELIDSYSKAQNSNYLEARKFEYDEKIKYFVTELSFYIPTYEQNNPSIPIIINNSGNRTDLSSTDSVNIKGNESYQNRHEDQRFFIVNGDFKLDNNSIECTNKMYADSAYIKSGEHITIKFGYNPATDIVTVLDYETSGGQSFTLGGEEVEETVIVKYYPLESNVNCALVNPTALTAVSSSDSYIKAVTFTDSAKTNVSNAGLTLAEQFTTEKSGTGYNATYKFRNNSSNTYLTLANGKVSYTPTGTEFTLEYKEGFTGPLIKANGYYLIVDQGRVLGVEASTLDTDKAVTVFTGTTYSFLDNLTTDDQPYQFYNNTTQQVEILSASTTPKLFTSSSKGSAENKVGASTPIVTLTKAMGEDYYTAHIVMRVWVEGTDREAKTPLADGIFDISLHFTSM